jgi:cysteine sulfinate desulfinase/cysteine desulfurase-like protein
MPSAFAIANTSASVEPSHVLRAMGLSEDEVASSIRISWGQGVSAADFPVEFLVSTVGSIRG